MIVSYIIISNINFVRNCLQFNNIQRRSQHTRNTLRSVVRNGLTAVYTVVGGRTVSGGGRIESTFPLPRSLIAADKNDPNTTIMIITIIMAGTTRGQPRSRRRCTVQHTRKHLFSVRNDVTVVHCLHPPKIIGFGYIIRNACTGWKCDVRHSIRSSVYSNVFKTEKNWLKSPLLLN